MIKGRERGSSVDGDQAGGGGQRERSREGGSGLGLELGLERQMARRGRLGCWASSLLFFNSLAEKKLEGRKRKRGLGKEFENEDNFPGLIKMSLIPEI